MSPIIPLFFLLLSLSPAVSAAPMLPRQLRHFFYSATCPKAEVIVRGVLKKAMTTEIRVAASLMRFLFHDCFVNGCDASLLLDDTPNMLGEKTSLANVGSLRSYDVISAIKEALEKECPCVVSCADIITMVSRDAVSLSGGPRWEVKLGRLDSLNASQKAADDIMPSPQSNASELITLFNKFNLSIKDMVALSGSHTTGKGRCLNLKLRLYNYLGSGKPDPAINQKYLKELEKLCPLGGDENVTGDLDQTPECFDNQYYMDLVDGKGFFNSDQSMYTLHKTRQYVKMFAANKDLFFKAFVDGMIKMAELQSWQIGEIRKNCSVVNAE